MFEQRRPRRAWVGRSSVTGRLSLLRSDPNMKRQSPLYTPHRLQQGRGDAVPHVTQGAARFVDGPFRVLAFSGRRSPEHKQQDLTGPAARSYPIYHTNQLHLFSSASSVSTGEAFIHLGQIM